MRIIAGEWRGRSVQAPAGQAIRPTSDRVRESLFSILTSRFDGSLNGLVVADFCAGTGALGLEALSRGAGHATFVDRDPASMALVQQNVRTLGAQARCTLIQADVAALPKAAAACDLILCDPPYAVAVVAPALQSAVAGGWTHVGTLAAIEQAAGTDLSVPGWQVVLNRRYGKTALWLLETAR